MSIRSVTTEQPEKLPPLSPTPAHAEHRWDIGGRVKHVQRKLTTRHGWLGDYDYVWLCMPTLPWRREGKQFKIAPPFYALDSELPILLAAASGLQHALAMLAGLITPPIIFASALSLDSGLSAYMISASLIGCGKCSVTTSAPCIGLLRPTQGILSLVQMSRLRLFGNYYLGTGLISVVGTSFATLSTANAVSRRVLGASVDFADITTDIRFHVCEWHLPHNHSSRRHGCATGLSRRIWDGTR